MPRLSIVVTTYEWPEALDAVLGSLADQSDQPFDVVVADDGSGPATALVMDRWAPLFGDRLRHAWQPDDGFRVARVRNLGALAARGDVLVFLDGDCVVPRGFVAAIRKAALPGWFLAGKRVQLSDVLSRRILDHDLRIGRRTALAHALTSRGEIDSWIDLTPRDRRRPWRPRLPDFAPEGNAYGFMTALSRSDFESVNGFDMRFVGWGEQDVDLATRLGRGGLRCGFAGPHSTVFHLAHGSHVSADRETWWLLQETRRSSHVEAELGLRELAAETDDAAVSPHRSQASAAADHIGR